MKSEIRTRLCGVSNNSASPPRSERGKPLYTILYVQVITAIALGVALGYAWPKTGAAMRPLGDGFIKLVRMMIAPIIFSVVVVGIAKMGDLKAVGRIGVKALIYFEAIVSCRKPARSRT